MPLSTNEQMLLTVASSLPEELKDQVVAKDAKLQEVGYKNYK